MVQNADGEGNNTAVSNPDIEQLVLPEELVILPLFDTIVFPGTVVPMAIAQAASIRLLDEAVRNQQLIGLLALASNRVRPAAIGLADCFQIGTAAIVHRLLRLPDGSLRVAMEGVGRFGITRTIAERPFLRAQVILLPDDAARGITDADCRIVLEQVERLAGLIPSFSAEALAEITSERDPARLSYLVATNALQHLPLEARQQLLELRSPLARLHAVGQLLAAETQAKMAHTAVLPAPARPPASIAPPQPAPANQPQTGEERLRKMLIDEVWQRGEPGVTLGLVANADAATVLVVEALAAPGIGSLELIGNQCPVVAESAALAHSWLRVQPGAAFGQQTDLFLHLPLAPHPINDPAIGPAIALALVSAITGRPSRPGAAICAILTLRGQLLPPANLAVRLQAARHYGITRLILPVSARDQALQLAPEQDDSLQLVFVAGMQDALAEGLAD